MNRNKLAKDFLIDSAATSTEEIGNPIYPPMKAALERAHIPIGAHRARQLRKEDYSLYDLFIGMDEENEYYMRQILGEDPDSKIHYLMEYTDSPEEIIEDPWYTRKFDHCTDQLNAAARGYWRTWLFKFPTAKVGQYTEISTFSAMHPTPYRKLEVSLNRTSPGSAGRYR